MAEKGGAETGASARFDELKTKIERASKLIARLREANYSLSAELAELHRRIGSQDPSVVPSAVRAPGPPVQPVQPVQL